MASLAVLSWHVLSFREAGSQRWRWSHILGPKVKIKRVSKVLGLGGDEAEDRTGLEEDRVGKASGAGGKQGSRDWGWAGYAKSTDWHSINHCRICSFIFSFMSGPSVSARVSWAFAKACWNSSSFSICRSLRTSPPEEALDRMLKCSS